MADLARFVEAQEDLEEGHAAALSEIRAGGKQGHWIWHIFPQLEGLGGSANARFYALGDLDEARAYMRDPLLGARLVEIGSAVLDQLRAGVALRHLMGSEVDVLKLVSCMTLFRGVAEPLSGLGEVAAEILAAAEAEGVPPCGFTVRKLAAPG